MRRPLAIGLAAALLLALPVPASAVLSGTNGRIVYISGPAFGNTQLFLRSVTSSVGSGSTTGPLATGLTEQHRHPTWSPDRTHIAFAEGPGPYSVYTLDLTTPGALPQSIGVGDRPAWSPDGTRIAYESGNDIIVHPLAGGADLNLTAALAARAWKAAWTPDSQTIYYSVGDISVAPNGTNNDVRIYRQPANNSSAGTEFHHASGAHVFQPSISPDGTKLCYTLSVEGSNLPTSAVVFAAPLSAPGSTTTIANSGKGDYNCTWSPDGTKVAYTEDYAGNGEVFMANSDGTSVLPINLSNTAGAFDGNPDWAPDGRPECPDSTVTTKVNTPVTFRANCVDTGPQYERTPVKESAVTQPAHGTLTHEFAEDPFTYTPNAGFTGTDSFEVHSFDDFGFGTDRGTVTITVTNAGGGGTTAKCGGKTATIVGTAGSDRLTGTAGNDVIAALGGNDRIRGGRGKDIICAGSGRDSVSGGAGGDRIAGGGGNDGLSGNSGNDRISGNGGADRLSGGSGRDTLSGGSGRDRLNGGSSRDRCNGGSSRDRASRCESLSRIP